MTDIEESVALLSVSFDSVHFSSERIEVKVNREVASDEMWQKVAFAAVPLALIIALVKKIMGNRRESRREDTRRLVVRGSGLI
jgi:hypothetical protein